MSRTKILCILDGFGLAPKSENNAIALAQMPNFRRLLKEYYWTTLDADGEAVGQEQGLVGNSEVGHMNLGGLKLVPQLSYQITKSAEKAYDLNPAVAPEQLIDPKDILRDWWTRVLEPLSNDSKESEPSQATNKTVHLIGLFSTGTIHSDMRHWVGAIEAAGQAGAEMIVLHLISDGRDSDRQSLAKAWDYFVETYQERLQKFQDKLIFGSLGGRFYAMDRDKNMDRVAKGLASMFGCSTFLTGEQRRLVSKFLQEKYSTTDSTFYDLMEKKVMAIGLEPDLKNIKSKLARVAEYNYNQNVFDEFIEPISFSNGQIRSGDVAWLINFRTDRMKQFTQMLRDLNQDLDLNLLILGMNDYGVGGSSSNSVQKDGFSSSSAHSRKFANDGYLPIFKNQPVQGTLAETISKQNQTQLHIAETEKYNHVTYFLNGGQNKQWPGEDWVVIDSNKVASHGEKPEMKAKEITDEIVEMGIGHYDCIIVNFANPDMVAHTGDLQATKLSLEVLDEQLGRIIQKVEDGGHSLIITADHGNAEVVGEYEKDGQKLTDTEHNADPVPLIIVDKALDREKLISNMSKFSADLDLETLSSILGETKQTDLSNSDLWLTKEQIPKPRLTLWYVGVILLSL